MTIEEAIIQALRELGTPEELLGQAIRQAYDEQPGLAVTGRQLLSPESERLFIEELKAIYRLPEDTQVEMSRQWDEQIRRGIQGN